FLIRNSPGCGERRECTPAVTRCKTGGSVAAQCGIQIIFAVVIITQTAEVSLKCVVRQYTGESTHIRRNIGNVSEIGISIVYLSAAHIQHFPAPSLIQGAQCN